MDLGRDKVVRRIISRLKAAETGGVKVEGTWGSFAPLLVAHISNQLKRPILYVRPHIDDADKAADDLQTFGAKAIEPLAAWEGEEDIADATDEIRAERLRVVSSIALAKKKSRQVVTASVQSLCQPVPKPDLLEAASLKLVPDNEIAPERVAEWLVDNGFERVERVDLPGQFARRGGIVDIYAPLIGVQGAESGGSDDGAAPVRVEFFGDIIESVRSIDLDTQRSTGRVGGISVASAICGAAEQERELFTRILPPETIVVLEEPANIEEVAGVYLARLEDRSGLYDWEQIYSSLQAYTRLDISRFGVESGKDLLRVPVKSIQQFQHKATSVWAGHKEALEELLEKAAHGTEVQLYCESPAEVQRVSEIARETVKTIPAKFHTPLGFISDGFTIESLDTIVISHHELFGQFALRRRQRRARPTAPVDTLADLQEGDYVVHASHGIGKFLGIRTIEEEGGAGEYLTIEYANATRMQVSVKNIALVQKYIGTSPKRPKLSKIGSKKWQKQKEKVAESVADLAAELLEVQAKRQALGGFEFGPDSNWQVEFEESFPYQETPDQSAAIGEIKADMQQNVAMDRLLCGDVGYGKTELAMRAAFKAVENGKQVAMLVPTTVLCVQHGRTFTERFADFPISIDVLNRFKTTRQAADVVARARAGRVDILIGTHRLLSKDVGFKDLGLLIIDEEQRFGVDHKERLKRMRVDVDVLTMTATPIPRTLHMSLIGLRDISSLQTPPLDRRSIVTVVTAYNDALVKKAIHREMNRQGQVFFLHNRVKTIEKRAWRLSKLVPDARITIAHGQMTKRELEKAMVDFVLGGIDVLVCTTIIESGLDIPNANTILIDDADRFGLAELHQLRGRVGRYKHRAYAYMLLPESRPVTPIATKRLKAIEEYSHLGAGFRIALRDLEIRGAGNILGAAQSGHIQLVGYQMYCELLANAVRKMKNEPVEELPSAVLDLGFSSYIPKNYVPIDRLRMDVYRKIAVAKSDDDIEQVRGELADVYGPLPEDAELVLELASLRIKASRRQIKSIVASCPDLIFSFEQDSGSHADLFSNVKGDVRIPDPKRAYLRLNKNYFEPRTLLRVLRKMFEGG